MRPDQRIVTELPLTILWDSNGPLTLKRQRAVGPEQIADFLRHGMVTFVIADCSHQLKWLSPEDCYRFWKEDVKPHLVEPDLAESGFQPEAFPGEYCYVGSEWRARELERVVLLETYH